MISLNQSDLAIVSNNHLLEDKHIDYFAFLLHRQFGYAYREVWYVQHPELIEKLDTSKLHIQILHSRDTEYGYNENDKYSTDHWVCSYYDTKKIYIFDSANRKQLHKNHRIVLERLYPDFQLNADTLQFPDVQRQPNNYDCGVYAIAYATSLALREWPVKSLFLFDHYQMRNHLLKIFQSNIITGFPKMYNDNNSSEPIFRVMKDKNINITDNSNAFPILNIEKKATPKIKQEPKIIIGTENNKLSNAIRKRKINTISNDNEFLPAKIKKKAMIPKNIKIKSSTITEKKDLSINLRRRKVETTLNKELPPKKPRNTNNKCFLPLLNDEYLNMVTHGDQLQDEHMYQFKLILANCSNYYDHRDTLYLARPENIEPVPPLKNHIQILYSTDKHWICSYYNTKKIYIYDSLNKFTLNEDQILFLRHLYPYFNINEKKSLIFMRVQHQRNGTDCGVFAIAFAISLLYNQKPECIVYEQSLMRSHLAKIFQTNTISHFPTTDRNITLNLPSLKEVTKRNHMNYNQRVNCANKLLRNNENNDSESYQKELLIKQSEIIINLPSLPNDNSSENSRELSEEIINIKDGGIIENLIPKQDSKIDDKNHLNLSSKSIDSEKIEKPTDKKIQKQKISIAKKIVAKYCRENSRKNFIKIKSSEYYINKLATIIDGKNLVEKHLEAQRIIKWCMCQRKMHMKLLTSTLHILKNKAEFLLSHLPVDSLAITIDEYKAMCGPSLHYSTTEPYFYETSYSFATIKDQIISMNKLGQSTNILPLLKDKHAKQKWLCNNYCRATVETEMYVRYKNVLEKLKTRNLNNFQAFLNQLFIYHSVDDVVDKLGHYNFCLSSFDSCNSELLCIELLSPHFPSVRYIKQLIYKMKRNLIDLNHLDKALESGDSEFLINITNKMKEEGNILDKKEGGLCLDEDKIQTENKAAFLAFTKRSLDLPRFKCISCQKLVFRKDATELSKLRQPISNEIWNNLINFINEQDPTMNSDFICNYCLRKIRSGSMPPTCLLNNMYVGKIPNEIFALNEYEKVLIQRAKAFQVVQRLGTVAKKNLPHTMRIQKLKGQTFHLPLPIEETLKKICSTTDPLNKHHELYIVMRSIPTKSNVIWEKMVSLENVFRVLTWLKSNNTLYSEIKLPQCPENLREWLDSKNISFQIEMNEDENCENTINGEKNNIVSEEEILNDQNVEELSNKSEDRENKGENHSITKDHSYSKISAVRDISMNSSDHTYSRISLSTNDKESADKIDIQENKSKTPQHQAMITQVLNPDSSQYAQYTIYPLHDKRKNDTSTNMYQMLKINEKALDNRLKTLDLQCFPDLYPYGKNGQCEERNVPLTAFEYIKARLKSADPRFRLNQQYLFFLLNDANIRQLGAGVYHTLNITNARERYTAQSYLKHLKDGQLEANLTTLFARLRNSEQFWSKPRNNLACMTRHYGPATWFFTVSPAEWLWDDLIEYIKEINAPHFDKLSASEVIAADPVSVSRFIDNKFQAVLEFIKSDSQPLGPLSHYFWRREYQGRGIQHFHLILWVEGAPIMGINTNEEVVEFIMKYVTCKLPDRKISPTLHRRVTTHQQHNHNSYCLRTKKPKSGKVSKACRFGFPRPVSENFVLRDTATSIAGRRNLKSKSRLYDLPRNENEVNINDYNPSVLSVWEGNMDIQFIGEKSTILTQYVTKYTTKKEITKSSETINEINSTKTLPQHLWNIGFRSLTHREVGALEAADTLLGISLHGTDSETIIKWLDVRMIRNRKLKTKEEIEELVCNDPESTEIFCPSLIDDYYPNRPKDLENLCLYNFAKWYDTTKAEPKNNLNEYYEIRPGLFLKKRLRGYLINHFRYNIANRPEDYFYSLLLLFQPWRNTDELKNGFETYTESFTHQQYMLQQANDYHEYNEEFEKGLEYIKKLIENKCNNDDDNNDDSQKKSSNCDAAEIHIIAKEINDAAQKHDNNNCTLADMINNMNADQMKVFEKIKNNVLSDNTKLRLYVSGEGGTGKSFLINVIKRWIREELNRETVVTAPTGIAAFNINGLTIHRVFQLPVEHGFTPSYTQLSDNVLKALRDQLQNTTLFIIDEISMVSNITLIYIHLRLVEIFDVDDWFGGKHVVVFGDLLQLPPVHENPSYVTLSSQDAEKYVGSLCSINLWTDLFCYEELRINMRQKTDNIYGQLLSRVRVASMTNDDIKLLEQRKITIDPSLSYNEKLHEICNYIDKLPSDSVCLVPTCRQCDLINSVMTSKISSEEIILTARDHLDCNKSLIKKVSDTLNKIEDNASQSAGLAKTITIKIGAKVMLRRNIDVTLGLVNGAIGTVKSVSKSIDGSEIQAINIDFGADTEYAIERIKVKFQLFERAFVVREQFPLCLSYAVTIHKSQGLSLKNAIIEAGNTIFNVGQIYVALSRVTELRGLHLINFDPHSVKASSSAIKEYNRLRKIYRSDLPTIPIPDTRWQKVWDMIWAVDEHSIQIEPKNAKKASLSFLEFRGIENCDNVSDGFNSIIQCMFNNTIIRTLLINHGLKNQSVNNKLSNLFSKYNNRELVLKSSDIKELLIEQPCSITNNDPVSVFLKICDDNCDIRNLVQFKLEINDRCKTCNYSNSYSTLENVLHVSIYDEKKTFELQELIDSSFGYWFTNLKICGNCKEVKETLTKISFNSLQQILVVKLHLSIKRKNKLTNRKKGFIKSVPKAKITLCNTNYSVVSAIFDSSKDGNSTNHHVAMIKHNLSWIQIDDETVQSVRWPANSKSAYVFFLQKK